MHPPSTVNAFKARAVSRALSAADRRAALTALGFIYTREAAGAVVEVAAAVDGPLRAEAIWWLLNQSNHHWNGFGIPAALKDRGIYDPDTVQIIPVITPPPSAPTTLNLDQIAGLAGNPETGKQIATACMTCHKIGDVGVDYAPNLSDWARTQTTEVIIRSIIDPSADIAHGYEGWEIVTQDGATIHGLVLSNGDPVMVQSMGGITQTVPRKRIESMKRLDRSLMLSAEQLGLSEQLVADVVEYLKSL